MGKQVLLFIEFEEKQPGMVVKRAKPVKCPISEKEIDSVWTLPLHTDPKIPPELPYKPVHHANAFVEDYMHDWNIKGGKFHYASRVTDNPVWVLIELK